MVENYCRKVLIIISLVLGLYKYTQAQQLRTYQGKYTLNSQTTGNVTYSYYAFPGDSIQFHGRFSFASDVLQFENNQVRQINISGNYRRGSKNGEWVYERNNFNVKYNRIVGVNIESVLDGTINRLTSRYVNGLPEGKWSVIKQEVQDSRRRTNFASSESNFRMGKASGKFVFNDPSRAFPLRVDGQFDNEGNLDGIWRLTYELDGIRYQEERKYASGFLLDLNLKNSVTGEPYFVLDYKDIKDKLNYIKGAGDQADIKLGDMKFDILFNDGYRDNDEKLLSQRQGNRILKEVFDYYLDSSSVIFSLPGFSRPEMGTTRRFQYVYPENELELLEILRPMVLKMEHHYDSAVKSSVLRINRQKSDTLAFYYELLNLALDKVKIIHEVLDEIESGKFDYQFRDNFYRNGVRGLISSDTVKFEYLNKEFFRVIEVGHHVNSPDSLVMNVYRYTISIDSYIERFYDQVKDLIAELQQEESIARLDEKIVKKLDTFMLTYTGSTKVNLNASDDELLNMSNMNELQLAIFKKYSRDILRKKMQEYVEMEDYKKKTELGESMLGLVDALITNYLKLGKIPGLQKELDVVYTRYSPNPFFERDVVTRIKQGIYSRGAEILLPHKIEELKRSSTKEEFIDRIDAIFKLDEKLRELADRDDIEISRLNSRIRRENQPERIKRLLGI